MKKKITAAIIVTMIILILGIIKLSLSEGTIEVPTAKPSQEIGVEELKRRIKEQIEQLNEAERASEESREQLRSDVKKYLSRIDIFEDDIEGIRWLIEWREIKHYPLEKIDIIKVDLGNKFEYESFIVQKDGEGNRVQHNLSGEHVRIEDGGEVYFLFYGGYGFQEGQLQISAYKISDGSLKPHFIMDDGEYEKLKGKFPEVARMEDGTIIFNGQRSFYEESYKDNRHAPNDSRSGEKYIVIEKRDKDTGDYSYHRDDVISRFQDGKLKIIEDPVVADFMKLYRYNRENYDKVYDFKNTRIVEVDGVKRKFELTRGNRDRTVQLNTYEFRNDNWVLKDFFSDKFNLEDITYRGKRGIKLAGKGEGRRTYKIYSMGMRFSDSGFDIILARDDSWKRTPEKKSIVGRIKIEDGIFKIGEMLNGGTIQGEWVEELPARKEIYTIDGFQEEIKSMGRYFYHDRDADYRVELMLPYLNRIIAVDDEYIIYCGDGKTFLADIQKKKVKKIFDEPFWIDFDPKTQDDHATSIGIEQFKNGILYYDREKNLYAYNVKDGTQEILGSCDSERREKVFIDESQIIFNKDEEITIINRDSTALKRKLRNAGMLEYINERHIITEEITNDLNKKVYRIYDRDTLDMKKTSISDYKYPTLHWGMSTMSGSNFRNEDDRVIYHGGGNDWTVDMVNSNIRGLDRIRNYRIFTYESAEYFEIMKGSWRYIVSDYGRNGFSDLYLINIRTGEKILIDENVRSFKDTPEFPGYDFRRSVNNWWNETLIHGNRIYYNNDWEL